MQQHIVAVLLVCVYGSYTSLHFLFICFLHSNPTFLETRLQNTAQRCYRGSKLQTTDTETHSPNSFQLIRKRVACLIRFCMDVPGLLWFTLSGYSSHRKWGKRKMILEGWMTVHHNSVIHVAFAACRRRKKNSVNYRQTD